jgi:putative peptide zinc metalloprotease protein
MSSASLKLRSDLIISEQSGAEGTMFVIKDPVVDRFFRFKEIEHFIAKQFDGVTSTDITLQRVEERFGVALSAENLEQFASRLQRIGLLTDKDFEAPLEQSKKYRIAGDIFYLRFKLFDPDKLFDAILPKIQFLFTPAFLISSAMLVLLAVSITMTSWPEIMHQFYGLFRLESLLLAYFIMLSVVTLHEFAHGLTCKHFGGHVREIGFMLIYFQPAFYCNVSDAWLFPKRSSRMWVTFAGAYFEIFLWALATITWYVTDPSTSINHFSLVVTATSAFKMFFNMNPLIKLDGYYLLIDWVNIPNLRQKSFSYLTNNVKRFFGSASADNIDVSVREKWILLSYAILAGAYTYWLLSKIIIWFGGYMVSHYQAWGFIIFSTALVVFFRNPLKRLFMPAAATMKVEGSKPSGFSKRGKFGVVLAILLALLFFIQMEMKVSGPFTVMPMHNADVRTTVEGIIEEIYVDEGDFVQKGAAIAKLSDRDYAVELQKTQAEIESKQAQLKLLKSGSRLEEIELAKTQLAKAEELSSFSQTHLNRDKQLVEKKYISQSEYEETLETATVRQREVEEAKERLKILQAGNRPEEIDAINADIDRLKAHEVYLQSQLNSLAIASPISGVVTTHKLREKIGENVKKGDLVAEVYELKTVTVEIAVPEKEIGSVKVGQKVALKVRAYPATTFEGKVNAIAPVATKPEEWQTDRTVLVISQLDNSSGLLKPEMTGNAKIYCG